MKLKTFIVASIGLYVSLFNLMHAQRVYDHLGEDFNWRVNTDGSYTFFVSCTTSAGVTEPCSLGLGNYLYEWWFGDNDCSVEVNPTRRFSPGTVINVSLRITGIKEERVGRCITDPNAARCTGISLNALKPSLWDTVLLKKKLLTVPGGGTAGAPVGIPTEYASLFGMSDILDVQIGEPYCDALWGAKIVYPVIFNNRTRCAYRIAANISDRIDSCAGAAFNLIPLCLNPSWNSEPACPTASTMATLDVTLAPSSYYVALVAVMVPTIDLTDENFTDCVNSLTVETVCTPVKNEDMFQQYNCDCPALPERIKSDTLVSTIDPNIKWISDTDQVYGEGEEISFAAKFSNIGFSDVNLAYFVDTLDPMMNGNGASNATVQVKQEDGTIISSFTVVFPNTIGRSGAQHLVAELSSASTASGRLLGPNDYCMITFTIPVKVRYPRWLYEEDPFQAPETIDVKNTVLTKFLEEDVWYESEPVHFKVERKAYRIRMVVWLVPGGLAAIIGLAFVVYRIRMRSVKLRKA